MPRKYDLTGQKFGLLTVKKLIGRANDRSFIWLCECQCGNTIEVSTCDLNRGKYTNCGCSDDLPRRLTNRKFGHLTALKRVGNYNHFTIWECQCDCGRKVNVLSEHLKTSLVASCGCSGKGPLPFDNILPSSGHCASKKINKKDINTYISEEPPIVSIQEIYEFVKSLGPIRLKQKKVVDYY